MPHDFDIVRTLVQKVLLLVQTVDARQEEVPPVALGRLACRTCPDLKGRSNFALFFPMGSDRIPELRRKGEAPRMPQIQAASGPEL